MFRIESTPGEGDRDGFGGRPYLRDGVWPVCDNAAFYTVEGLGKCKRFGEPMTHFARFDIRAEWQTPFPAGTHVSLFLCVGCADAFIPPAGKPPPWQMPPAFWDSREVVNNGCNFGWWYAAMDPPGAPLVRAAEPEPLLVAQQLSFVEDTEGMPRVGGKPSWVQSPEGYVCQCGETMQFLVQFPENFEFKTLPGAPEQRGTYSKKKYMLFLGNETYLFACPKGCHPRAILPVNQN